MPARRAHPDSRVVVRLTANFERNLAEIDGFLAAAEAAPSFDALLDELLDIVVPNLERYPNMGRPFLDRPPGSVEVAVGLEKLRARLGSGELREYLLKDYVVLYLSDADSVGLLSIKHHRQLSFDFDQHWGKG